MQVQATQQYKRVEERHYSAHHTLLHIAWLSLRRVEDKQSGEYYEAFTCITFAALAVEALVNAVGVRVMANWPEFERLATKEKLKTLKRELKIPSSAHHEVWRQISWLNSFRNSVAHPKPEHIIKEVLLESPMEPGHVETPESSLEKLITFQRARDSYNAVNAAKNILAEHMPSHLNIGLEIDGWSSGIKLVKSPIATKNKSKN